jgi:membrane-bound lytic murein transglycosylase A
VTRLFLSFVLFLFLLGCFPPRPTGISLQKKALPPLLHEDNGTRSSLEQAVQNTMSALATLDPAERVTIGDRTLTVRDLRETLSSFLDILDPSLDEKERAIRMGERFDLYEVPREVLFTGYYEPLLSGSLVPTDRFRYPLYRRPEELKEKTFHPGGGNRGREEIYFSRKEIDEEGALRGRGLELVYLEDPVERFFLHVEGAGSIRLPDQRILQVQYDGCNNRPYRSIGKILIEEGKLASGDASLPGIKTYLNEHPADRDRILNLNERYVFFKITDRGSQGVLDMELTPYRSLATDPRFLPTGSLLFYVTRFPLFNPEGKLVDWREEAFFAVSQDIGEAIEGPLRADIYMGVGAEAAIRAGHMMSSGRIYVLLRKPDRPTP